MGLKSRRRVQQLFGHRKVTSVTRWPSYSKKPPGRRKSKPDRVRLIRMAQAAGLTLTLAACSGNPSTTPSPSLPPSGLPTPSTSAAETVATVAPVAGRIAYVHKSADETRGALVIRDADGTKHPLTRARANVLDDQPDWSPDGKRLIFTETKVDNTDHGSSRLMTISRQGKGLKPLTPGHPSHDNVIPGYDDRGTYSHDGRSIAYTHAEGRDMQQIEHSNVYTMEANGKHPRQVSKFPSFSGDAGGVAWSPDGKQLVFSYATSPMSRRPNERALFIINADGTHMRQLTQSSLGAGGIPDWSAQTNFIVFRAVQDDESGVGNFFTITPQGKSLKQVTHFDDQTVISHKVSFGPDGKTIIFAKGTPGEHNDVFTITVDGTNLQKVTDAPEADTSPDWAPAP